MTTEHRTEFPEFGMTLVVDRTGTVDFVQWENTEQPAAGCSKRADDDRLATGRNRLPMFR